MAHFDFTRPLADWTGASTVTPAEMGDLDSKTKRAINGDEGGAWAPTDVITIGGDGLEVSGELYATDVQHLIMTGTAGIDVTAASRITIESGAGLDVDPGGLIAVEGSIVFAGASVLTMLSGAQLTVQGGSEINILATADLDCAGSINLQSGGEFNTASGASVFFGAGGTITRQCVETRSGSSGRTVLRTTTVTNLNSTPDVSADVWFITINDGNTYSATLDVTSPLPTTGEVVIVRKIGTSGTLTVNSEGPISIAVIGPGEAGCATCVFDGTQWRLTAFWASGDPAGISSGA